MNKRIVQAFSANMFGQVVNVLDRLVTVPIFLAAWGVEYYGAWILLSTIPAYIGLSEIGLTTTSKNDMCMQVARENYKGALQVFHSTWAFILLVCMVVIALSGGVYLLFEAEQLLGLLNVQGVDAPTFWWTIALLTGTVLLSLNFHLFLGIYRASGQYAKEKMVSIIGRLVTVLAVILLLSLGKDMVWVAGGMFLVRLLSTIYSLVDILKQYDWFQLHSTYVSRSEFNRLISPSLHYMAFPMGQAFSIQGTTTLIGIYLGANQLVVFNTIRTLTGVVKQFTGVIMSTVWPEFSRVLGKKELSTARLLYHKAMGGTFWSTLLISVALYFLGGILLQWWTLGKIQIEEPFFSLMLCVLVVEGVWQISRVVIASVNEHIYIARAYFLAMAGAIFVTVALLKLDVGLSAVPISLLLVYIILIPIAVRQTAFLLKDKTKAIVRAVFSMKWMSKV